MSAVRVDASDAFTYTLIRFTPLAVLSRFLIPDRDERLWNWFDNLTT